MTDLAVPSIVTRTSEGKILAVWPLKPVPVVGLGKWNARIGAKYQRRQA